jgi:glycosyltransferase involved in cell wall biosynthesis
MTKPSVGLLILTYNHAPFVKECIESVLAQNVEFTFKIHIADDASTDGTVEILKSYSILHPDKINLHLSSVNRGAKTNFFEGYRKLEGYDYVSLIDGDDFWCNPEKLQLQIAFLEKNPKFVAATHNTILKFDKSQKPNETLIKTLPNQICTVLDLISGAAYFHTSSIVCRNIFNGHLPSSQLHPLTGDWFLSILYAEHGDFYYFDEPMSTYRIHASGDWGKLSLIQQTMKNVDAMVTYDRLLEFRYSHQFTRIWWACDSLIPMLIENNAPWIVRFKYYCLQKSINVTANQFFIKKRFFGLMYKIIYHLIEVY